MKTLTLLWLLPLILQSFVLPDVQASSQINYRYMGYQEVVLCGSHEPYTGIIPKYLTPLDGLCDRNQTAVIGVKYTTINGAYGMQCNGTENCNIVLVDTQFLVSLAKQVSVETAVCLPNTIPATNPFFLPPPSCGLKGSYCGGHQELGYCSLLVYPQYCQGYCLASYVRLSAKYTLSEPMDNVVVVPALVRFDYYTVCDPNV